MIKENDIERMLQQEIYEKKIMGYGQTKQKSTRRGMGSTRRIGGMRFPHQILSKEERKEYIKPGKVKVYNMKDIIKLDEFLTKSEKEQKNLLITWRDLYKNDEIIDAMEIGKAEFYNTVAKFELARPINRAAYIEKILYSDEQMKKFLQECTYEDFMGGVTEQREILLNHYDAIFTTKELTEYWGATNSQIYGQRYNIKKWRERQDALTLKATPPKAPQMPEKAPEPEKVSLIVDEPQTVQDEPEDIQAPQIRPEQIRFEEIRMDQMEPESEPEPEMNFDREMNFEDVYAFFEPKETPLSNPEPEPTGAEYKISGVYSSEELSERLEKINLLISNESSGFEINLMIKEIPQTEDDKTSIADKEKMEKLLATLGELIPSVLSK